MIRCGWTPMKGVGVLHAMSWRLGCYGLPPGDRLTADDVYWNTPRTVSTRQTPWELSLVTSNMTMWLLPTIEKSVFFNVLVDSTDLTVDLSSSRIQMAALGYTSTPFCFVIRQLLSFFPGQVHLSEVPFDDIYPVLPRSSWLSLVTSQFPVCCLTRCSRVVHSQDVSQPPEPSFFNYIFQFPWTSFLSDVFVSDLVPPCDPQQSSLELVEHNCVFFNYKKNTEKHADCLTCRTVWLTP